MPGRDQIKDVVIGLNLASLMPADVVKDTTCVNNRCIPGLKNAFFATFRQGSG
jgi:hypothetical protein